MNSYPFVFWLLACSGIVYWGTVGVLVYRVRHSEHPLIWNFLGFAIGILAFQTTYEGYLQVMGDFLQPLSLVTEGLSLLVSLCLLASVVLCTPFLNMYQRNRELLAVIEERNVIIHQFHERIATALRQVQMAMEVGKPIQYIIDQIAELSKVLQVFLEDLKAGVLLGNKFEVALKTLVDDLCKDRPITMAIHVDPTAVENLPYDQGCELLHIVREAVKNVVEHAQAKKGWVVVKKTETARILEISDNGKGFEVDLVGAQGHGLGNMVLRAKNINARLKVHSQPKKGGTVIIEIPLDEKAPHGTATYLKQSVSRTDKQKVGY